MLQNIGYISKEYHIRVQNGLLLGEPDCNGPIHSYVSTSN